MQRGGPFLVCFNYGILEDLRMGKDDKILTFGEATGADSDQMFCVGTIVPKQVALCLNHMPMAAPPPAANEEECITYRVHLVLLEPKDGNVFSGGRFFVTRLSVTYENYPELFGLVKLPQGNFIFVHCFHVKTFHGEDNHTHHIVDMIVVREEAQDKADLLKMDMLKQKLLKRL